MLSIPLHKGDFYETHASHLALIHSTCSSNRQSELKVTHANTPTTLPHFKNVIADTIKVMQKIAVVLKLRNVTFTEFFTSSARNNVGKPTYSN